MCSSDLHYKPNSSVAECERECSERPTCLGFDIDGEHCRMRFASAADATAEPLAIGFTRIHFGGSVVPADTISGATGTGTATCYKNMDLKGTGTGSISSFTLAPVQAGAWVATADTRCDIGAGIPGHISLEECQAACSDSCPFFLYNRNSPHGENCWTADNTKTIGKDCFAQAGGWTVYTRPGAR